MKNYITNEILPDILHDLAEKFLENPEVCINISMHMNPLEYPALRIGVAQYGGSFNERVNLTEKEYQIIPKVSDVYDVIEDTLEEALSEIK